MLLVMGGARESEFSTGHDGIKEKEKESLICRLYRFLEVVSL